jgi:hypothetical protein
MKHHSLWSEPPAECEKCGAECDCDLIAKVRADTLDSVINLLEEMHSERVWWNDMLTWCISVNEAISQIDNIRWEKEEV